MTDNSIFESAKGPQEKQIWGITLSKISYSTI